MSDSSTFLDDCNMNVLTNPPEGAMLLTGYDDAIIGEASHAEFTGSAIAYSESKILKILRERAGMTHQEAIEFFEFNILSIACMPEVATFTGRSPVFVS